MLKNPYIENHSQTLKGADIEAEILEQAAMKMRKVHKNWEKEEQFQMMDAALQFNQKIWNLFQADIGKNTNNLPDEIRQNILSLSVYVRKTTLQLLSEPSASKLNSLIQINESLANGLKAKPEKTTTQAAS